MMRRIIIVVLVLITIIIVLILSFTQHGGVSPSSTNESPSTSSTSLTNATAKLAIHDIVPQGFHIVDETVYLRFKIVGEVDLRNKLEINGVYGSWTGFIKFIAPNGVETWIFTPPDYYTGRDTFNYLVGSVEYDAPVYDLRGGSPSATHPQSSLNGTYVVKVLLSGPYDEERGEYTKVLLMEKRFNYTFKVSINLHTLNWSSWSQDVDIHVINEGDVPVFFTGAAVSVHGVDTIIGWLTIQDQYVPIDINQSRNTVAKLVFLDDYKPDYEGKVKQVDILFEFKTVSYINMTFTIDFPD